MWLNVESRERGGAERVGREKIVEDGQFLYSKEARGIPRTK